MSKQEVLDKLAVMCWNAEGEQLETLIAAIEYISGVKFSVEYIKKEKVGA